MIQLLNPDLQNPKDAPQKIPAVGATSEKDFSTSPQLMITNGFTPILNRKLFSES